MRTSTYAGKRELIGHLELHDLLSLGRSVILGMQVNVRLGTFHGLRYWETNPS